MVQFGIKTVRAMLKEGRSNPTSEEVQTLLDEIEAVRERLHSDTK
jgi:hypothetical protein